MSNGNMQGDYKQPRVSGFREALSSEGSGDYTRDQLRSSPIYEQWASPPSPPLSNRDDDIFPIARTSFAFKERPISPALASPGLESIWSGEGDKEVCGLKPVVPDPQDPPIARKERRLCGLRKRVFYLLVALLVLLAVGLGVGLGIGLGMHHATADSTPHKPSQSLSASSVASPAPSTTATSAYNIGGSLNAEYFSTTGAFNGSGIALASQSFGGTLEYGVLVGYYQHYTGDLRYLRYDSSGNWYGGTGSEIVAQDAKNSAPISAVAYVLNGTSYWHIFYLNQENLIRQRSNNNATNLWTDGPINTLNLLALNADEVGMQACWYGNDYGDSDYLHSPLPSDGSTSNSSVTAYDSIGMHMWYASDNRTFQQYGWRAGDTNWTFQETWPNLNGHAGVGCYSWGPGTVTYAMFVDLDDTIGVWWKDTNTSLASTKSHPINVWTNTSIAIPGVHPSTSLGYTNFFYAQMASNYSVMGYNISWDAENSTIVHADTFAVGNSVAEAGLPGTHFSVSTLPTYSGGNDLVVFYQTTGADITEFTRDLDQGQWTTTSLPVNGAID